MRKYHEWKIDPLKAMVEYCHSRGWELYVFVRYRNFHDAWPVELLGASRFYLKHPGYRLKDPKGDVVMGLSVAYPEVRRHLCQLYAEIASYGVDGICLGFNRGGHIVLYEPPIVEGFRNEYKEDPRNLPELDHKWLDYKCKTVTTFMQEVKDTLGTKCRLSAIVHGTEGLNRRYGLDIPGWVAKGVVNDMFVLQDRYTEWDLGIGGLSEDLDFDFFQNLTGREKIRLWPMLYMWQPFGNDPKGQSSFLQKCLDKGADGYAFWDAPMHPKDLQGNIWELGKNPRPQYQMLNRLLGKHALLKWDGYRWNKYSAIGGW
jgi:hypothetical protein